MKLLRAQDGMALLLVLVLVALLSALLTEFSFSTLVDLRAAETFRDRTQAYYLARGGVEAARMILQQDQNPAWDHPSEFWGDLPTVPVDNGAISLKIEDLTGRLNLHFVTTNHGVPSSGYSRFVELCQEVLLISPNEANNMASALADWQNPDPTLVSADDSYYSRQQPPYTRSKQPLKTLGELLLVHYFDADKVQELKKFIRVDGTEPININTAPKEVLEAWQHYSGNATFLDSQEIDALVDYRQQTPIKDPQQQLNLVPGLGQNWSVALASTAIKGSVFQVTSNGTINDVTRQVVAVIDKANFKILSYKVE